MNESLSHPSRKVCFSQPERKLNIGLHAQTLAHPEGVVAGSEVTTQGLKKALRMRPEVNEVTRYGPGNYGSVDHDDLDLLIIEGWDTTLSQFIQRVRKHHPRVKILFYNLSLLGFENVVKLDVDAFLSNSKKVIPFLQRIAPTRFILLAVDHNQFKPVAPVAQYSHNVIYLGMFHPGKSPVIMKRILYEALDFGLAIYGSGWNHHPDLKQFWQGKLPTGDIALLYSSAKIVLGLTEDRQKAAGMINNRVFEALSCGACFISEYYQELEKLFGETIFFSCKTGDTGRHIEKLLSDASYRATRGASNREFIIQHHTYEHRVQQILDFYREIRG
ncbi:glycosyltransferase [candidate division CSSED10-310 bacterium]|uniref:Glycosyltransferase n=1 Tax=candidate division CSSED10-310 bacterium TaxID=2855610 RepID=A0ABV6Z0S6_UNCC1